MLCYQDFKDTFVCNTQQQHTAGATHHVVLSGFQRYFCMQYTTHSRHNWSTCSCVIRISKILLYAIHNSTSEPYGHSCVVLSGFQRYFCMQYTTHANPLPIPPCCVIRISKILLYAIHNFCCDVISPMCVVLSGFQRYFCMQYTTFGAFMPQRLVLLY